VQTPSQIGLDLESSAAVHVWILWNNEAGRSVSSDHLRRQIERAGHRVVALVDKDERRRPSAKAGVDLVVAAGGDGTVAAAAGMAAANSLPLAVLPLGTANNIARSLGLDVSLPDAIESWRHATLMPFDLGYARVGEQEHLFTEGIGGGLVPAGIAAAEASAGADDDANRHPADEVVNAVQTFHDVLTELKPSPWTIVADGHTLSGEFLLVEVLNIRSIGPNLMLSPDADASDGLFDVITAGAADRGALLHYLEQRTHGRECHLTLPVHRAREIAMQSCAGLHIDDERLDACRSGDIAIRVVPGALNVLSYKNQKAASTL
jgi:diacylglycerol kinase family enzyme